jgi:uncharacterized membrane protein YgaE (UPF0421/DUF939 family)
MEFLTRQAVMFTGWVFILGTLIQVSLPTTLSFVMLGVGISLLVIQLIDLYERFYDEHFDN